MGRRTVKNYPSPRLLKTIGATNLKPAEAIGELVANCFDARVPGTKLDITVDLRDEKIAVIDNGKGMDDYTLEHAVCIGEDMSKYISRGEGAKGHFGMGFKTACSTLGGYYEIFTRPIGESVEYHVAFDISEYSMRPTDSNAWDVDIEDGPHNHMGPLKDASNGTAFVISALKVKDTPVSAVLEYLGEAFKGHLSSGDQITIIDSIAGVKKAEPKKYHFLPGTKIDIDTAFGPNKEYRITGWAAIDEQTHNNGLYGFNIYRNGQLIESNNKDWFKAHLMTSRLIGEASLDFLDATFYKQGLQQSELWILASRHMTEFIKPLERACRSLSRNHNVEKPVEAKKIIARLREEYEEDPFDFGDVPDDDASIKTKPGDGQSASVNTMIKNVAQERRLVLEGEGEIAITYLEREMSGSIRSPFDYIYDDAEVENGKGELQIIVYQDHPLWKKRIDDGSKRILATSDGIYRMLVEQLSFNPSEALRLRNDWVWERTNGGES